MTMVESLYDVLGAATDATDADIKGCYHEAVLRCHPDKLPLACSEAQRAAARQQFMKVDTAWRTLGNSNSRKRYDAMLAEKSMRKPLPVNEEVHIDDMDWDEDENIYKYNCRCGGHYIVSDKDIHDKSNIVCCNTCTLSIRLSLAARETDRHTDGS